MWRSKRLVATPEYVPQPAIVEVRVTDFARIPPPRKLVSRPVEMLEPPREPGFGVPCPDAGYGFQLGHELDRELVADPMENREDAHWAVATLAVRRAGRAGRAPRVDDIHVGRALLGYDGTAPTDLVRWHVLRLRGISREPELGQWLGDIAEQEVGVSDVHADTSGVDGYVSFELEPSAGFPRRIWPGYACSHGGCSSPTRSPAPSGRPSFAASNDWTPPAPGHGRP